MIRALIWQLAVCVPTVVCAAEPITTGSLIEEMIDFVRLGAFPDPGYKTVQFSSYDHRSVLPGGPDWFANSDGFGREPVPNFEAVLEKPNAAGVGRYLICDVEGPGAIVRTWTAAIQGTIRVFLDGGQEPVFDGPAREFLQESHQGFAEAAGLDPALFDGTYRQRDACYFPIPFAKQCRIEWTGDVKKIHFYEVQVRRYEPTAKIVTFRPDDLKTYAPILERVAGVLADPQGKWKYRSRNEAVTIAATIPPGQRVEVANLTGPAALERLTVKLSAGNRDQALRQTVLHIVFDDHPWGQVQCPVGDFFGAAPGVNPFNSVPFTVQQNGEMTCRYVMPFARSCRILLQNHGAEPVKVTGSVLPLDGQWDQSRSMYFRARWRIDHDLVADSGAGAQDLPFLIARGSGLYVGTAVMLLNPNPIPTSYGNWWGEGDEKIFVDDDVRPSTFGTGSEDYFNYSWSSSDIFLFPFCGQPRNDGPANRGFVVNQRWHVLDALPFRHQLAFYMELYSHERTPGVSYARIAYHYGRPGIMDDHVAITDEDVRMLRLPQNWQPAARMGARGSTFFQAEDLLADTQNTRTEAGDLWSGGQLLAWSPKKVGEMLNFGLPVSKAGKYVVRITAAKTPKSGNIAALLDEKPLAFATEDGKIGLETDFRTLSRTVSTPPQELDAGDHKLSFRWLGPTAEKGETQSDRTVGIDFVWIQRR